MQKVGKSTAHQKREKTPQKQVERRQEPTGRPGGSSRHRIPSGSESGQAAQGTGNLLKASGGTGPGRLAWPSVAGALASGQVAALLGLRPLWGLAELDLQGG